MHILITRGLSGDFLGGAETEITDFSYELNKRGNKVSLITNSAKLIDITSGNLYKVKNIYWPIFTGRNLNRINSIRKFKNEIITSMKDLEPDIVLCQSRDDLNALSAYCKKQKIPIYYRDHSDLRHHLLPNRKSILAKKYQAKLVKSLNNVNAIFTNSPFEVPIIEKYVKSKIYVLLSGINFDYKPAKRDFNKKSLVFGMAARLVESKGVQYFIEALSTLDKADLDQIEAVVYGGGEDYAKLIQLASAKSVTVDFTGHQNDMKSVYKNIDVLVQASEYEGWSRVVSEAMYSGCVVLASDIPSHSKQIDEESGITFRTKNSEDLSSKIQYLLHNRMILPGLSQNAQKKVIKTTAIQNTTKYFLEVINDR